MKIWCRGGIVGLGLIAAVGLLGGCQEKAAEKSGSGGQGEPVGEVAIEAVKSGVAIAVGGGEKAAEPKNELPKWSREAAGFARHLPQDTEIYFEARKLEVLWELFGEIETEDVVDRLKLDAIADAAGKDAGQVEEWKAQAEEELTTVFPAIFGEEVFVSVRGLDWWLQPYLFYAEELYPDVVAKMTKGGTEGKWFGGAGNEDGKKVGRDLREYLKERFESVDGKPVLSVQMGGKVSEGREEVLEQVRAWFDLASTEEEAFVKVSFERNGVQWKGVQFDWAPLLKDELEADEEFEADQENLEELMSFAAGLPLVAVCGEVGEYVVLSVGLGEHSVETVTEAENSLVADEAFDFLTEYELDSVVGVSWSTGKLAETVVRAGSSAPAWEGMAEGFRQSERLETGPEVANSLMEVARLSRKKEAGKAFDSVGALVMKNGLHLESRGGWLGNGIDLASPLPLAAALDAWEEKPFFRAHWKTVEEHTEMTLAQFEEVAKVVRIIGGEISEAVDEGLDDLEEELDEDEQEEAERERQLAESMRRDFLKGVENLWVGYRDHFRKSLGEEVALIMDFDGAAPPIVGLDEKTLEKGKIPRLAYVRPVNSREGLQESWKLWRDAGVRFLGLISEAFDTPIPFPDTMSADSNDLRTHFFPMPFATDDFLPSLSVSDELFIVGTSKALASRIDKATRGVELKEVKRSGILVELEMGEFWDFTEAWLEVAVENWGTVKKMTDEDFEAMEAPAAAGDDAEEPEEDVEELLRREELPADEEPEEAGEVEIENEGPSWLDLAEVPFVDLEGLEEPEEIVRRLIDKARWWKGVSYRRWLDDGVPRSSASIHWGEPGAGSE